MSDGWRLPQRWLGSLVLLALVVSLAPDAAAIFDAGVRRAPVRAPAPPGELVRDPDAGLVRPSEQQRERTGTPATRSAAFPHVWRVLARISPPPFHRKLPAHPGSSGDSPADH